MTAIWRDRDASVGSLLDAGLRRHLNFFRQSTTEAYATDAVALFQSRQYKLKADDLRMTRFQGTYQLRQMHVRVRLALFANG